MSEYSISGIITSRSDSQFDSLLEAAYKAHEKPLCLCTTPAVEMYIAKVNNAYVLKRLPNSGAKHHSNCSSYEMPAELSGRGEVENKAISEDKETGLTNLKLNFSLSKTSVNRGISSAEGGPATEVKAEPTKLSIKALLHVLYEDAHLNHWYPKMKGKRNWYIVQKNLYAAAENKLCRKNSLVNSLMIPEPFSLERKDEIAVAQKTFLSKLKPQGKSQPMGILIGEVKTIEKARFGHKMIVKHMPEIPFFMGEDVYKRINKLFEKEFSFFEQIESIHLLTICTFSVSATGFPQIDTISFMLVDANWLPFETYNEWYVLDKLTHSNRQFIKALKYNLSANDVIASIILTGEPTPVAVYLVQEDANTQLHDDIQTTIELSDIDSKIINFGDAGYNQEIESLLN